MSEEKNQDPAPAAPAKKMNAELLLVAVNALAVFAAIGAVVYTKILYQKPKITEAQELEKLEDHNKSKSSSENTDKPLVAIDELRVNLASPDGSNHFAVFTLTAECLDEDAAAKFNSRKDQLIDKLINLFNRKKTTDINHVQGRLILKEEILKELNAALGGDAVHDVFFSTFLVQ